MSQPEKKSPPTKFISAVFGLFALGMVVLSLIQFYNVVHLLSTSSKASGEIVSLTERDKHLGEVDRGNMAQLPTVQFTTKSGETIMFTSSVGTSNEFEVGDKVTVYYPETDPQSARVSSFFQLWFSPIFLFIVGAPVSFVCFLVFKFSRSNPDPGALERKKARLSAQQRQQVDKITDLLDK